MRITYTYLLMCICTNLSAPFSSYDYAWKMFAIKYLENTFRERERERSLTCYIIGHSLCFVLLHTYIHTYLNIIVLVCVFVLASHWETCLPQSMTHRFYTTSQMSSTVTPTLPSSPPFWPLYFSAGKSTWKHWRKVESHF